MKEIAGGYVMVNGEAEGSALVSSEPISFWGDIEPETGRISSIRHPLYGQTIGGKMLVFPRGRGSTSGSGVLLECIRLGTNPSAIITCSADPIIAAGSLIAKEMYGRSVPIVVVDPEGFSRISTGDLVTIAGNGTVKVCR